MAVTILHLRMMQPQAPPFASQDDLLHPQIQAANIQVASPRLDEEVQVIDQLERFVVINMDCSEQHPLYSNYCLLTSIYTQQLQGRLSFSQGRDLEQVMASDNPGKEVTVQKSKTFS